MWPFSNNTTLAQSGLFDNFTDFHSHILPGVDDGFQTMDDSLQALRALEQQGVVKIWLTPHVMEDYPNATASLRSRFEELKKAWKGNIELHLASENMLDTLFEQRLGELDLLTIGSEGRHLLVETSYFTPPMNLEELLERTFAAGYFPVIAHPERYRYMERKDYARLREMGCLFQTNLFSVVGAYGETAREKAEWLLEKKMIDVTGTDLHRLQVLENSLQRHTKSKKTLNRILDVASNPVLG